MCNFKTKYTMYNKTGVIFAILMAVAITFSSCKKETIAPEDLYIPTEADVTSTATLEELQQGRILYINNCGECHALYSPDSFSTSRWGSIMDKMAPKTSMTSTESDMVLKYVRRGNS